MFNAKTLTNDPQRAATEAIEGYLLTRPDLCALPVPFEKVVLLRSLPPGRVAVLSGGGAGHEPAHAGLVAAGLLSAAVSGDVFASPSTAAVRAALRALRAGGAPSCVLVVKNYQGDRLAFGAAAEEARGEGFPCEVVLVADDVALPGGRARARGLAGTALVHKVAGALAARGEPLEAVARGARLAARACFTVGASLTTCSLPGQPPSARLAAPRAMEVGLGIHGEPGARQLGELLTADTLAKELVDRLLAAYVQQGPVDTDPVAPGGGVDDRGGCGCPEASPAALAAAALRGEPSNLTGAVAPPPNPVPRCAILVNGLGGLSALETGVFTRAVVAAFSDDSKNHALDICRLFVAPLVTSLDAKGVSVTLMLDLPLWSPCVAVGDDGARPEASGAAAARLGPLTTLFGCLDAPTECPHWPRGAFAPPEARAAPAALPAAPPAAPAKDDGFGAFLTPAHLGALAAAARELCAEPLVAQLNALDSAAGDSDAGDTMRRVGGCVAGAADELAARGGAAARDALAALGAAVGEGAGGTSGVLYAMALHAGAAELRAPRPAARGAAASLPRALSDALSAGLVAVARHGGAARGERTLLDALLPAAEELARRAQGPTFDCAAAMRAVVEAARAGAEATRAMAPRRGRAAYVDAAAVAGHEDAGAAAAVAWLEALARAAGAM
jgi:dihydroxyacetone kinase